MTIRLEAPRMERRGRQSPAISGPLYTGKPYSFPRFEPGVPPPRRNHSPRFRLVGLLQLELPGLLPGPRLAKKLQVSFERPPLRIGESSTALVNDVDKGVRLTDAIQWCKRRYHTVSYHTSAVSERKVTEVTGSPTWPLEQALGTAYWKEGYF